MRVCVLIPVCVCAIPRCVRYLCAFVPHLRPRALLHIHVMPLFCAPCVMTRKQFAFCSLFACMQAYHDITHRYKAGALTEMEAYVEVTVLLYNNEHVFPGLRQKNPAALPPRPFPAPQPSKPTAMQPVAAASSASSSPAAGGPQAEASSAARVQSDAAASSGCPDAFAGCAVPFGACATAFGGCADTESGSEEPTTPTFTLPLDSPFHLTPPDSPVLGGWGRDRHSSQPASAAAAKPFPSLRALLDQMSSAGDAFCSGESLGPADSPGQPTPVSHTTPATTHAPDSPCTTVQRLTEADLARISDLARDARADASRDARPMLWHVRRRAYERVCSRMELPAVGVQSLLWVASERGDARGSLDALHRADPTGLCLPPELRTPYYVWAALSELTSRVFFYAVSEEAVYAISQEVLR